jgi:Tol biopolymer transport system component
VHTTRRARPALTSLSGLSVAATAAVSLVLGLFVSAAPASAAFAGENGRIAFASLRDGNYEIYAMDPGGQNQTRLTDELGGDIAPAFSPDGATIAFQSARDGNSEIYSMDAGGQDETRLTDEPESDFGPAFFPDGTRLAFTSGRDRIRNDEGDIVGLPYVMGADGANQIPLTFGDEPFVGGQLAFSSDGTKVAFQRGADIWTMDSDGQNATNLAHSPAPVYDFQPTLSPDGTKIAWARLAPPPQGYDVYVMDADGHNKTRLTDDPDIDQQPAFSPDGTRIAFTSYRTGQGQIWAMTADGANETQLTDAARGSFDPDWGPARAATIADLIKSVEALGLPHGVQRSLVAKLRSAQRHLDAARTDRACGRVDAFIRKLEAQRSKPGGAGDTRSLVTHANAVRASLGCP